jgi:transcriptional regulator with XRE-family HTH domain
VKNPGRLLKSRREAWGLTQQALADLLECEQSAISRAERGQAGLGLKTAIRLAQEAASRGDEFPVSMWIRESSAA